jgi:hypothetical protein
MLQLFLGRDYNNKIFPERKEFFESCSNQWGWVLVKDPKSSFVEEGMLVLITVYLRITWFLVLPSALPKPYTIALLSRLCLESLCHRWFDVTGARKQNPWQ